MNGSNAMIQAMDARVAREKNRRPAKEGFNTLYMGLNRYHRTPETVEPDPNSIYRWRSWWKRIPAR
jgi:hypothetical protein